MRLPTLFALVVPFVLAGRIPIELRLSIYSFESNLTYLIHELEAIDPEAFESFKKDPRQGFRTEIILGQISNGTFDESNFPFLAQFEWFKPTLVQVASAIRDLWKHHTELFVAQEESLSLWLDQFFPGTFFFKFTDKLFFKMDNVVDFVRQNLNETMKGKFDAVYNTENAVNFEFDDEITFISKEPHPMLALHKFYQKLLVKNSRGEISDSQLVEMVNARVQLTPPTRSIFFNKEKGVTRISVPERRIGEVQLGKFQFPISVDDENDAAEIVRNESSRNFILNYWLRYIGPQVLLNHDVNSSLLAKALEYEDSKIVLDWRYFSDMGFTVLKSLLSLLKPRHLDENSLNVLILRYRNGNALSFKAEKILAQKWLDENYSK